MDKRTTKNPEEQLCYSGTRSCEKSFPWRISDFSMYAQKGCRTSSSEFESLSGSKWRITLCLEEDNVDGKCVDFITVHLENIKCDRRQFVKVKMSICDCLGQPAETNDLDVLFDSWNTSQKVFSISKDYLMTEMGGLNRMLLVPNDVLTFLCEMTITEESEPVMLDPEDAFQRTYSDSSHFSSGLLMLWYTKALIYLRPTLFQGWKTISPVINYLAPYWGHILSSIFLIYVCFDVIVWIIATVCWILMCLIWGITIVYQLRYALMWGFIAYIVWKANKFFTSLLSNNKNKKVVQYQQPGRMQGYTIKEQRYYLVPESYLESLKHYLGSQMCRKNGPGVVWDKKRQMLTNHYYQ